MFNIDLKSSLPIYEQVINSVKESLLKGYFKSGDALPSVRKLSTMLGVNPNTVAKAYTELERQGLEGQRTALYLQMSKGFWRSLTERRVNYDKH